MGLVVWSVMVVVLTNSGLSCYMVMWLVNSYAIVMVVMIYVMLVNYMVFHGS